MHSARFSIKARQVPTGHNSCWAIMADSIWTEEDRQQLTKLIEKAERHGQSLAVFSGPPASSFSDASDFSMVTDLGGMGDAAKRRAPDSADSEAPPGAVPRSSAKVLGAYLVPGMPAPPFAYETASLPTVAIPAFPPGVNDLHDWGKSIFLFGKHKGRRVSYAEVLFSTKQDDVGYVKWSRAHASKAEGFLKDWCVYLHRHSLESQDLLAGPMIPETSTVRKFKKRRLNEPDAPLPDFFYI